MNITFLMGNGFDIGIGLRTRYTDFYPEYSKELSKDNNNIYDFKHMLRLWQSGKRKILDWADYEKAFGEHSQDFSVENKEEYLERFEDFVLSFNEYLEKEEKNVDYTNKELIAQTMKNAINSFFDIREADKEEIRALMGRYTNSSWNCSFISFNYTNCVDRCVDELRKTLTPNGKIQVDKCIHIHGYVEENMIMGVNDSLQIVNQSLANDSDLCAELVKPLQNADARTNYEKQMMSIINLSDIICIYGMSIGATDKKWWETVIKWLSVKDNRALIVLAHDIEYNKRMPFLQKKCINRIRDRLQSYSQLQDAINQSVFKRVFIGINHDVFAMSLRKKEEKKSDGVILNLANYEQGSGLPAVMEDVGIHMESDDLARIGQLSVPEQDDEHNALVEKLTKAFEEYNVNTD